ncbi:MAG: hypothetical protein ACR2KV_05760 [Solirubrobacteraceae bacterium]
MEENPGNRLKPSTRTRLLARLDAMVGSGRVTSGEAARLRAAADANEFDATITDIRIRHAGGRLDSAVEDGALTRAEAEAFVERIRRGEHSTALRAHLRGLLRAARPGRGGSSTGPAPPHE